MLPVGPGSPENSYTDIFKTRQVAPADCSTTNLSAMLLAAPSPLTPQDNVVDPSQPKDPPKNTASLTPENWQALTMTNFSVELISDPRQPDIIPTTVFTDDQEPPLQDYAAHIEWPDSSELIDPNKTQAS